ncbi:MULTISPECIES: putative quinol monooxygenase [Actinoalloteichus]|uniref:Antibiotic biosynthesis monooxygenase n=1 Tax=Actinoalloteichus fjordicus TaxID=1612552 RepID=A0AAC9PTC7_9PSEU|nr:MULTISPECIES: antibiotic biosynthesis monooxygenase [Actinoalloteichus]APU15907.1 Antibiotic biosynthesis monooxygenase [Actinoalloteichus fjordicus]APU21969.1 Antibiotic biosynthesis monooxygenase [Actinoalloteichus sp. GBA129-24]
MLIISGKLYVEPADRDTYLARTPDFLVRSRARPGCVDFVMAADPIEPGRINLLEVWESEEHLAAHQATANPPEPMPTVLQDDVKKYQISAVGSVFG